MRSSCTAWRGRYSTPLQVSIGNTPSFFPEFVSRFEFATVSLGLVFVDLGVTIGPAQEEIRSERENNGFAIDLCLDARAPRCRRKVEVQSVPKHYGISFAHQVAGHGMNDFGLNQESSRVRPVTNRNVQVTVVLRKLPPFDLREGAGSRNAGDSRIVELVAFPGVKRDGANCRLPLSVGRARR